MYIIEPRVELMEKGKWNCGGEQEGRLRRQLVCRDMHRDMPADRAC